MRELNCQRCGARFDCGKGAPGCWCEQLPKTPGLQHELSHTYTDCLCRRCLESRTGTMKEHALVLLAEVEELADLPRLPTLGWERESTK